MARSKADLRREAETLVRNQLEAFRGEAGSLMRDAREQARRGNWLGCATFLRAHLTTVDTDLQLAQRALSIPVDE